MIHSYPWYPSDWRGSETRMRLTLAERSIYRDLLDHCWEEGSLPTDERMLAGIAGASQVEFKRAWPSMREKFQERDGRLFNRKVDEKRAEVVRWHAQKRTAGKASVEARRQRKVNGRSTDVQTSDATDAQRPVDSLFPVSFKPSSSVVGNPLTPFATADWESPEDCQPDFWVPKFRSAHPKPSKIRLVEQFCVDAQHRLGSPEEFRDFMCKVFNSLVIWTEFWRSDGVKFAPKLEDWLESESWTKEPAMKPISEETKDF